jgi:hypothetical protein
MDTSSAPMHGAMKKHSLMSSTTGASSVGVGVGGRTSSSSGSNDGFVKERASLPLFAQMRANEAEAECNRVRQYLLATHSRATPIQVHLTTLSPIISLFHKCMLMVWMIWY